MSSLIELNLLSGEISEGTKTTFLTTIFRWGLVITGASMAIASVFTFGRSYESHLTEAALRQKELEMQRLKDELNKLREMYPVLITKKNWCNLQKRRDAQEKEVARLPWNKESKNKLNATNIEMAKVLDDNVNKKPDENGVPAISVELDSRGPEYSKIKFRGDKQTSDVPLPVKDLTKKNITWNNSVTTQRENAMSVLLPQKKKDDSPKLWGDSNTPSMSPSKRKSTVLVQPARPSEIKNNYPVAIEP